MTSGSLIMLGARLVGVVFFAAAIMKVATPYAFYRHVGRMTLGPYSILRWAVPTAVGLEGGLGVALVVGAFPRFVLPFTAVLLVILTGITVWSVRSGKTEDCGCYGGFVTPSIGQSVALNGFYLLLTLAAWATLPQATADATWKLAAVLLTTVIVGGIASYALGFEFSTSKPLFTPSPLKVGRRWKSRWAGGPRRRIGRTQLIAYLGPSCPHCQRWVRVLNVIRESPELPPPMAVMASSPTRTKAFVRDWGLRVPVVRISETMMQRIAPAVPTTVLVEDGVIEEVWIGQMSDEFVERFKRALFPDAVKAPLDFEASALRAMQSRPQSESMLGT